MLEELIRILMDAPIGLETKVKLRDLLRQIEEDDDAADPAELRDPNA